MKGRDEMGKWKIGLAALGLLAMLAGTGTAEAAPQLEVKATGGIDGKVKEGAGFPLAIEVHNSGDPFSGDLILDFRSGYMSGTAEAVPVEVGEGETVTVRTTADGADSYSYRQNSFKFFEGGWENGKEVPYKGDRYPQLNFYFEDAGFIIALSESGDRLASLKDAQLGSTSETVLLSPLQDPEFRPPTDKNGWGSADVIIADEAVLPAFSAAEQTALGEWVEAGGTLLIGMTDDPDAEAGPFAGRLPLKGKGREDIPGSAFSVYAKGAELPDSVPGFSTELTEGASSLASAGGLTLAAWKPYGAGEIIQTAFSLGDRPFAGTPAHTLFVQNILSALSAGQQTGQGMYADLDEGFVDLGRRASERFETFRIPVPAILVVVLVYIAVIGPLLYVVLKRKDKREQAWWIIPAISLVVSAALFGYGAKDRLFHPQLRQAAMLIDDGSGSLSGKYVGSVLTNRGGDVEFHAPSGMTLTAAGTSNPFTGSSPDSFRHAVAEKRADGTRLVLRELPFWSVGTVHGDFRMEEAGTIKAELKTQDGKVSGTITNGFGFRLKDVAIWSGTGFTQIGDMEAGSKIQVEEKLAGGLLLPAVQPNTLAMGGPVLANGYGGTDDPRASAMMDAAGLFMDGKRPAIVARTDSSVVPLEMKGKPKYSSVAVIVRPFEPEMRLSGPFTVPSELLETNLQPEDPNLYHEELPAGEVYLEPGRYSFEATVPATFNEIAEGWEQIRIGAGEGIDDIEILNTETGEYEPISLPAELKETELYLSEAGTVSLRFVKTPDGEAAGLPEITIEGVAGR